MTTTDEARQRGRRLLLLLAAIFFLPLAVAFLLYYGSDWRPRGYVQHGELVTPAVPLAEVSLPLARGGETGSGWLKARWTVVYVGDGACDARCRQALVDTRQVRLALDKDMDRVQRAFLYRGACCQAGWLDGEQPELIAASIDSPAAAALLAQLDAAAGAAAISAGRLYLVDPLGNLMMTYAPDAPARDLLKDLERLLKLSHIG